MAVSTVRARLQSPKRRCILFPTVCPITYDLQCGLFLSWPLWTCTPHSIMQPSSHQWTAGVWTLCVLQQHVTQFPRVIFPLPQRQRNPPAEKRAARVAYVERIQGSLTVSWVLPLKTNGEKLQQNHYQIGGENLPLDQGKKYLLSLFIFQKPGFSVMSACMRQ